MIQKQTMKFSIWAEINAYKTIKAGSSTATVGRLDADEKVSSGVYSNMSNRFNFGSEVA